MPQIWYTMSAGYSQHHWKLESKLNKKRNPERWCQVGCGGLADTSLATSVSSFNRPDAKSRHQLLPQGPKAAIFVCSSVVTGQTHKHWAETSAATWLPRWHPPPQTPKFLYGVVLTCPPSGGFQYDIGGPQVTSSSPFFSSFHVPLFSPSQRF